MVLSLLAAAFLWIGSVQAVPTNFMKGGTFSPISMIYLDLQISRELDVNSTHVLHSRGGPPCPNINHVTLNTLVSNGYYSQTSHEARRVAALHHGQPYSHQPFIV
jgi:hypothetical protein